MQTDSELALEIFYKVLENLEEKDLAELLLKIREDIDFFEGYITRDFLKLKAKEYTRNYRIRKLSVIEGGK